MNDVKSFLTKSFSSRSSQHSSHPSSPNEFTPLIPDRSAPTRASYTVGERRDDSADPRRAMKRVQSTPALPSHKMRLLEISPLWAHRLYLAKGGTMTSSAFNLASATLGAGALALPYAMLHSGTIVGIAMLMLVYTFTVYSIFLLIEVGELHDLHSYEALAMNLVGPLSEKLSSIIVVTFCWGVAVMYVVVMGDFVKPLVTALHLEAYIGRKLGMILFWTMVMGPLSLLQQVNSLRYASIVGSGSTLLLAAALVVRTMQDNPTLHTIPLFKWDSNSLGSLSTFVFSYCCQPLVFSIYSEMKGATVRRMSFCASISMLTCTTLYIVTGFFGVAAFGDATQPNVLSNFAERLDTLYVQLAFFGMAITVTMAFPITIFPTRESVVLALGYTEENPVNPKLSCAIGGVLAFLALLTGLYVPNIRVLFDILGGVCGGSLSFLLPGLFALRSDLWTRDRVGLLHILGAWATFFMGIGMCVLGTYNSIYTNFIVRGSAPGGNGTGSSNGTG